MFLVTDLQIRMPIQTKGMYTVKLRLKFRMVGCCGSLVITVISKSKEYIHTTVTLLLLILHRQEVGR